jgi:hypothetical protein
LLRAPCTFPFLCFLYFLLRFYFYADGKQPLPQVTVAVLKHSFRLHTRPPVQ